MTFLSYIELVTDYFFSDKSRDSYNDQQQQTLDLAIEVLTTHGVGGKFAEKLVRYHMGIADPDKIHGWDGWKDDRPIEIKTETINYSKAINCEGSFAEHREGTERKKDLFLKNLPLLISVGVDDVTGKCLYIMETDTGKLPEDSLLFERLDAKSPRINFSHWNDHEDSYHFAYKNLDLIRERSRGCFSENLYIALGAYPSVFAFME